MKNKSNTYVENNDIIRKPEIKLMESSTINPTKNVSIGFYYA